MRVGLSVRPGVGSGVVWNVGARDGLGIGSLVGNDVSFIGGVVGFSIGGRVGSFVGGGVGSCAGGGVVSFVGPGVNPRLGIDVGTTGTSVSTTCVGVSVGDTMLVGDKVGLVVVPDGSTVGAGVSSPIFTSNRIEPGSDPARKLSISIPVERMFPRA